MSSCTTSFCNVCYICYFPDQKMLEVGKVTIFFKCLLLTQFNESHSISNNLKSSILLVILRSKKGKKIFQNDLFLPLKTSILSKIYECNQMIKSYNLLTNETNEI